MHDLLAANPAKLEAEQLVAYAKTLGLDVAAFAKALKARTHRAVVERDVLEAQALGATGTLTLFINGRRGNGVPPVPVLNGLIKNLLAGGDGIGPAPVSADDPRPDRRADPRRRGRAGDHRRVLGLPVRLLLARQPDAGAAARALPGQGALVFKHIPIEGHTAAPLAHRAAYAAHQQGKFWEMHDRIFANQRAMERRGAAGPRGRARPRHREVHRRSRGPRAQAVLDRDQAEAAKVGIDGTPTFFVNGTPLVGAQPLEAFTAAIDKALAAATAPLTPPNQ